MLGKPRTFIALRWNNLGRWYTVINLGVIFAKLVTFLSNGLNGEQEEIKAFEAWKYAQEEDTVVMVEGV
ncbi:hypothetical protein L1887_26835 [Cichorium endivia]|nr:hypothetical protein L1887_26835 [Cichorium endivia]